MERGEGGLKSSLSRSKTACQVKEALSGAGDPLSRADTELLDLLAQWDANGDGQYSVEEVLLIARHFKQQQRRVTNLKRTLCLGSLFTLALLIGVLFVSMKANEMTKDMRPNSHGILTTNYGKVAGVAQVMRRSDLNIIPNMTDDQLAELQFVSFDLNRDHYMLKVAGAVRRHTNVTEVFFVDGPFTEMKFDGEIKVVNRADTSEVAVPSAGDKRRLAPWMHISQKPGAGLVGLSGTDDVQVAGAPWTHITR